MKQTTFLTDPVQIAPTCKPVAEAKRALAEAMSKIAANDAEIEKHREVVRHKTAEIETLRKQTPADISARIARDRRKLLLKIALGDASDADLSKFDKSAAEEQKAIAKQSVPKEEIKTREDVVAEANDEINRLTAEGVRLLEVRRIAALDLCESNYEAAGVEYLRMANELRLIAAKAVAWGDLHKNPKLRGNNDVGKVIEETSLMPLGTKSTHNRTPSFSNNEMRPLYIAAEEEVIAGLAADGLELFPPPKVAPPRKAREQEGGIPVSILRPEDDRFPDGFVRPAKATTE